jgi:hypothetical protein
MNRVLTHGGAILGRDVAKNGTTRREITRFCFASDHRLPCLLSFLLMTGFYVVGSHHCSSRHLHCQQVCKVLECRRLRCR